jgi:hypothetical protein
MTRINLVPVETLHVNLKESTVDNFLKFIIISLAVLGIFFFGRFYQIQYMLHTNDAPSVQKILDKNCVKL